MLRRQLEHRFGPLPQWALDRLAAHAADREGWAVRLLEAASLEEQAPMWRTLQRAGVGFSPHQGWRPQFGEAEARRGTLKRALQTLPRFCK